MLSLVVVLLVVVALSLPIGQWLYWVFQPPERILSKRHKYPFWQLLDLWTLEKIRINAFQPQNWTEYVKHLFLFQIVCLLGSFMVYRFQGVLPLNPHEVESLSLWQAWDLAATSAAGVNSMHFTPEKQLSLLSQLWRILNLFLGPAVSLCALALLTRSLVLGFAPMKNLIMREEMSSKAPVGNFELDIIRVIIFFLLPMATVWAFLLLREGSPQVFALQIPFLALDELTKSGLSLGPVASFVAIKQVANGGGGYFSLGSMHPFETPTAYSAILQIVAMLSVPCATLWFCGKMLGRTKMIVQIFTVMMVLFLTWLGIACYQEAKILRIANEFAVSEVNFAAGNTEGKESRLGIPLSMFWNIASNMVGNGSAVAHHESLSPLSTMAEFAALLQNLVFSPGKGFLSFFVYLILGVFMAGLMVGQSPAIFGKRIESSEMKLASIGLLIPHLLILIGATVFLFMGWAGPASSRTFTRLLYEFSSLVSGTGSGLEGLKDQSQILWTSTFVVVAIIKMVQLYIPLAIGYSLQKKGSVAQTEGSLPVESGIFTITVACLVILISTLIYFPAAVLGPLADHFNFYP